MRPVILQKGQSAEQNNEPEIGTMRRKSADVFDEAVKASQKLNNLKPTMPSRVEGHSVNVIEQHKRTVMISSKTQTSSRMAEDNTNERPRSPPVVEINNYEASPPDAKRSPHPIELQVSKTASTIQPEDPSPPQ